jgi:hypothetical protein
MMSPVQYLLEPPQVCIFRHHLMPTRVHRLPKLHHYGPPQGPSYQKNSAT